MKVYAKPAMVDLIFVPAGQPGRKTYALELHRNSTGQKLLLSVARFEIRRLSDFDLKLPLDLVSIARSMPPEDRHFLVTICGDRAVDIRYLPRYPLGTLREILGLVAWLKRHPEVRTLQIVSSRSHLPRIALCCKALLPNNFQVELLAVPNEGVLIQRHWRKHLRLLLTEFAKFWLYCFVLVFLRPKPFTELVAVK